MGAYPSVSGSSLDSDVFGRRSMVRLSRNFVKFHDPESKIDVTEIPETGTWFQLIANGTTSVNTGANGLQKLDMIIKHAESFGIYVLLTLTNNWAPLATDNLTESIGKNYTIHSNIV